MDRVYGRVALGLSLKLTMMERSSEVGTGPDAEILASHRVLDQSLVSWEKARTYIEASSSGF